MPDTASTGSGYVSCVCSSYTAVKTPIVAPALRVIGCFVESIHLAIIQPYFCARCILGAMGSFSGWPSTRPKGQRFLVVTRQSRAVSVQVGITTSRITYQQLLVPVCAGQLLSIRQQKNVQITVAVSKGISRMASSLIRLTTDTSSSRVSRFCMGKQMMQ